jgi:hypothetical protein
MMSLIMIVEMLTVRPDFRDIKSQRARRCSRWNILLLRVPRIVWQRLGNDCLSDRDFAGLYVLLIRPLRPVSPGHGATNCIAAIG